MDVLVFGEILWDVFPEGRQIGGAPFNLAAHLAKLGAEVTLCTAVGDDAPGREALAEMERRGIRRDGAAVVGAPTGFCTVSKDRDGRPVYDLAKNVAYDEIPFPKLPKRHYDALCFGTLAQRSAVSRNTISRIINEYSFKEIFCDVNIRAGFHSREILAFCLEHASVLKASREEAGIFRELGFTAGNSPRELFGKYPDLRRIVLTLDRDGAEELLPDGGRTVSRKPTGKLVSAVGAGDSFSAAYLWSLLSGKSGGQALEAGVLLSEYVVTQLGAVPEVREDLLRRIREL
ncbi:MAG TPA: PfkB family carbohydrate kinase [Oscillospiraceae bacterium]|nr:PfkB family carbohydrate kinase [Oscillospiraceae bacterium]HRW56777.1 PfkB family carbohydrate kinase [Oscillospiraceae bacterium]